MALMGFRLRTGLVSLVLFSASGASAAETAVSSVALSEAERLCVANHARPDKVLMAADTTGWTQMPGGRLLETFDMVPAPNLRTRIVGADQLLLRVEQKSWASPEGSVTTYKCSVMNEGPDALGVAAAVSAKFRIEPSEEDARGAALWIYVEEAGERVFLPASKERPKTQCMSAES